MQFPYWLDTATKRLDSEVWSYHTASLNSLSGPNIKHVELKRKLRRKERAPQRAHSCMQGLEKLNPKTPNFKTIPKALPSDGSLL